MIPLSLSLSISLPLLPLSLSGLSFRLSTVRTVSSSPYFSFSVCMHRTYIVLNIIVKVGARARITTVSTIYVIVARRYVRVHHRGRAVAIIDARTCVRSSVLTCESNFGGRGGSKVFGCSLCAWFAVKFAIFILTSDF